MKLLVTGGLGFLGSNLAARAIKLGTELLVIDNLFRQGAGENLVWLESLGRFHLRRCDIRSADEILEEVKWFRPDTVFHVAGQVAMTTSLTNPRLDFEVNALGTFNLLEAMRLICPNAVFLYASTNKVYGDLEFFTYDETESRYVCREHPTGFRENLPLDFRTPYGCSKGTADQYVLDYSRRFGLQAAVFRHSTIFGGRQFATVDQGWIGWFCKQMLDKKRYGDATRLNFSGTGKQVRDLLYVDDAVDLYFMAAARPAAIRAEAFNIGGGHERSLSILELLALLERELEVQADPDPLPARASDQKVFIADYGKALCCIGWKPSSGLHESLVEMLNWLQEADGVLGAPLQR